MLISQPNTFRFRWVHPSGATTGSYKEREPSLSLQRFYTGGSNVPRSTDVASTGASPMESVQLF